MQDYVEIGGASGLDTTNTQLAEDVCGLGSTPGNNNNNSGDEINNNNTTKTTLSIII